MSESKTYVFGQDSNNGLLGLIAPLLQKQSLDPNAVLAMMNGRNGNFGEGGWFMWILFLFIFMWFGGNGYGFGGRNFQGESGLANMLNNDAGRDLLMQAIQGNGSAISQLASTLGCSIGDIQQSVNALMTQVQQVGNQVGQSGLQVINAIQSGNASIASQLASCCCENRLAICQQTNTLRQSINSVATGQERGFSSVAYETARQTCDIKDAIKENTATVVAGQRAAEMRELQREIAERDRKISEQAVTINNGQQTAIFGQMIQQATSPLATALAGLKSDIDSVKCKLPETTNIPYSPVVGVPTCVAAQYGLGTLGLGAYGIWG